MKMTTHVNYVLNSPVAIFVYFEMSWVANTYLRPLLFWIKASLSPCLRAFPFLPGYKLSSWAHVRHPQGIKELAFVRISAGFARKYFGTIRRRKAEPYPIYFYPTSPTSPMSRLLMMTKKITQQQTASRNFRCISFLALLCATAQQSYCRHAGDRR